MRMTGGNCGWEGDDDAYKTLNGYMMDDACR